MLHDARDGQVLQLTSCLQPASLSELCSLIIFITESEELPYFLTYSFFSYIRMCTDIYIYYFLLIHHS